MKLIIKIIFLAVISSSCTASEIEEQGKWSAKKVAAVGISTAALGTWAAYELGDNTTEGRHNVKVYWGVGIGWMAGLIFDGYVHQNDLEIVTTDGQSLTLNYRF